ncbi:MAG: hypothetical protein B6245_11265 [Desulfobacteraceae bacterium 4572_88]|nr:MAG: hypothetical protein B6245_11265 [Desulfobacteraceae bacterium 4572_88]
MDSQPCLSLISPEFTHQENTFPGILLRCFSGTVFFRCWQTGHLYFYQARIIPNGIGAKQHTDNTSETDSEVRL